MSKFDLKKATINILSGGSPGNTLEINIGDGTLTVGEKRNIEYVKNRGKLDSTREGDEEPVDVKLDFVWDFLTSTGAEPVTPKEAIKGIGAASSWTSSSADPCEPYAVNIEVVYAPTCEDVEPETHLIQDFRWESIDQDFKAGMVSVSGKANVPAMVSTRG